MFITALQINVCLGLKHTIKSKETQIKNVANGIFSLE